MRATQNFMKKCRHCWRVVAEATSDYCCQECEMAAPKFAPSHSKACNKLNYHRWNTIPNCPPFMDDEDPPQRCLHEHETMCVPTGDSPFVTYRCDGCGRTRGSYMTVNDLAKIHTMKCTVCGKQATKRCETPRAFAVCGAPLCDACSHCL